jgi:hypothetical protein
MSILFLTKGWLTVAQLAGAWTAEILGAEQDPQQFEQELVHLLLEDIVNKRRDDAGPLAEGRRLGLRVITPDDMSCPRRHGGPMRLLPRPSRQTIWPLMAPFQSHAPLPKAQ